MRHLMYAAASLAIACNPSARASIQASQPFGSAQPLPRLRLASVPGTFRRFVREDDGREVHLRGFNAVVKGFPWLPTRGDYDADTSLTKKDFEQLQSVGLNLIRLGVMWPGLETRPGVWNHTYIQDVRQLIIDASSYGIYTLLDMHQDMIGPQFCGEGIVDWLANSSGWKGFPVPWRLHPFPVDERGYPSVEDCRTLKPWPKGQASIAVAQAFQSLFDEPGRSLWAQAWRVIAEATRDLPGVLGYELINEPMMGDIYRYPALSWPPRAERVNLQPAYDAVASAIRSVAPDSIIFFEPSLFTSPATGFEHAPGGADFANRSVLAFHHYPYEGFPSASNLWKWRAQTAKRLDTGLFASELMRPTSAAPLTDKDWCERSTTGDQYAVGWTLWELKPFCKPGWGSCHITGVGERNYFGTEDKPNTDVHKAMGRPFAPVVGGWLVTLNFNTETTVLNMKLNVTRGETEVFLSPFWFPNQDLLTFVIDPPLLQTEIQGLRLLLRPRHHALTNVLVEVTVKLATDSRSAKHPPDVVV